VFRKGAIMSVRLRALTLVGMILASAAVAIVLLVQLAS
jgi:hypothetical protein